MSNDKISKIQRVKGDANKAKDQLISLEYELRDIGANREADKLSKIIWNLEAWQQ